MEYQDKLNILETVLNRYKLSLNQPDVHDFFFRDRRTFSVEEYNEDGKKCQHSSFVKPKVQTLTPLDFENSGYFNGYRTLIEWFMYENSSSNPLVWNNIGKPTFNILESYQKTREYSGPVRQSLDGKIYNGEDANHRLLTLIINQFIETKIAQNEQEKHRVLEDYSMTLEVSKPISAELHRLLYSQTDKYREGSYNKSIFPNMVREFRIKTFEHYRDAFYCVSLNEETSLYEYKFDGEKFSGTEQELINWLKTKETKTEPIMSWQTDGVYYISCNNKVLKSTSKEKIEQLYPKVKKMFLEGKMECSDFLEIKDIDSNLYEIQFPSTYIEDKEEAKYLADAVKYFLTDKKEIFTHKLKNVKFANEWLEENIEKAFGFFGGFSMCDLIYKDLTQEEFKKLQPIICELSNAVKMAKNPNLMDEFN